MVIRIQNKICLLLAVIAEADKDVVMSLQRMQTRQPKGISENLLQLSASSQRSDDIERNALVTHVGSSIHGGKNHEGRSFCSSWYPRQSMTTGTHNRRGFSKRC